MHMLSKRDDTYDTPLLYAFKIQTAHSSKAGKNKEEFIK